MFNHFFSLYQIKQDFPCIKHTYPHRTGDFSKPPTGESKMAFVASKHSLAIGTLHPGSTHDSLAVCDKSPFTMETIFLICRLSQCCVAVDRHLWVCFACLKYTCMIFQSFINFLQLI